LAQPTFVDIASTQGSITKPEIDNIFINEENNESMKKEGE
jgi:hypothetical protein